MWRQAQRPARWSGAALLALFSCLPTLLWPPPAAKARERESGPTPALRFPLEPLGFRPPGKLYMLQRYSSSSLDFLDATHLLLTFRQPRLLSRSEGSDGLDQQVSAQVLELPEGKVVAQDQWLLHDRQRYLWRLSGDKALLRIGSRLYETNAKLELSPMYNSPTALRQVELSPDGKLLVMESDKEKHSPEEHERLARRAAALGNDPPAEDVQVRMVRLTEPKVMLNAHADEVGDLPATVEGFFSHENVKSDRWRVRFHPYEKPEPTGGDIVAEVDSSCQPTEKVLNDDSILVLSCPPRRGDRFVAAYTLKGQKLWDGRWQSNFTWPAFRMARDGATVAISWLAISHPVTPLDSINDVEVQSQVLTVLDSRNGGLRLAMALDPITTAGGNFALSADGNRLAVLNKGAVEVYDLPQPVVPPTERAAK